MPTTRRYHLQERRLDYDAAHVEVLLTGRRKFNLPSCAGDFFDPGDPEHPVPELMHLAWKELRGQLLPKFIAEHPGCRPAAWWCLDAPEPMRRIVEGYDCTVDPERPAYTRLLEFGRYTGCGWTEMRDPPIWESQTTFLDRHGLLSPEEVEVVGKNCATEAHCQRLVDDDTLPAFRSTDPPHKDRAGVDCVARLRSGLTPPMA